MPTNKNFTITTQANVSIDPSKFASAKNDSGWNFKTELNKLAAAICPDCKGAGTIALLSKVVPCKCRSQPQFQGQVRGNVQGQVGGNISSPVLREFNWLSSNGLRGVITLRPDQDPADDPHDEVVAALQEVIADLKSNHQARMTRWPTHP